MAKVCRGEVRADSIPRLQARLDRDYPADAMHMNFITNHDENSWNGTVREKFGEGAKACAVLTYVLPGMPLLYSGQEAGLSKRLRFFDKDTIDWSDKSLVPFYQALNKLKHEQEVLWNPPYGGGIKVYETTRPAQILVFEREKDGRRLFVMMNLSASSLEFAMKGFKGKLKVRDAVSGTVTEVQPAWPTTLGPWEFRLGMVEP